MIELVGLLGSLGSKVAWGINDCGQLVRLSVGYVAPEPTTWAMICSRRPGRRARLSSGATSLYPPVRVVEMSEEDARPLIAAGWVRAPRSFS
jgi:hypothetical protein